MIGAVALMTDAASMIAEATTGATTGVMIDAMTDVTIGVAIRTAAGECSRPVPSGCQVGRLMDCRREPQGYAPRNDDPYGGRSRRDDQDRRRSPR